MALAEKIKRSGTIVTLFLGDGTFGEGVVYEAFNLASLWSAPVLFVVENNHIAQTTPTELALAGKIRDRFGAFDIPVIELDSSDVLAISSLAEEAIMEVRKNQTPRGLILNTFRFAPHSKGADTRPTSWIEKMKTERDPIQIHAFRLASSVREAIDRQITVDIEISFQQALGDPVPV